MDTRKKSGRHHLVLVKKEERIHAERVSSLPVSREEIRHRVYRAAKQLLDEAPALPISRTALIRVADENKLPIRQTHELDSDPVAYAIFIKAYAPEAVETFEKTLDRLVELFRAPTRSLPA